MKRPRTRVGLVVLAAGCASAPEALRDPGLDPAPRASASASTAVVASAAPAPSASAPTAPKARVDPAVQEELSRVSKVRGLPIHAPVPSLTLGREAVLAKMKQKVAEELPPDLIALQGEALRGLGLIPPGFDLEQGFLNLFGSRIAGFYDPDEQAMYMLDDLGDAQADETLPHELVHALQDQSFAIGEMMDYRPGESDRTAALQHLVEGDATLAGFKLAYGESFDLDPGSVKLGFLTATLMSDVGAAMPRILIASIVSPYSDGYAFARTLENRGGFALVDEAFRNPPTTTEQILHPERYAKHELALVLPKVPLEGLPDGYRVSFDDQNGELGLRLIVEQWTSTRVASAAAEGWGGDRWIVAELDPPGAKKTDVIGKRFVTALVTRMDSTREAAELEREVKAHLGKPCSERADLGPIAWSRSGADVTIVAGPWERTADGAVARGDCAVANAWLKSIGAAMRAKPAPP